ncbi:serine protease [Chitinophaga sp. YIM B06452]|uniref:S1 family peptidase n=1 Tax=Chitinophaga sp. YIM B06452 TaxID=3082158 RepID=UPI0031FE761F
MKLTPVLFTVVSVFLFSCNEQSNNATTDAGDSTVTVPGSVPDPGKVPGRWPSGEIVDFPIPDSAMAEYFPKIYKPTYFAPHQLTRVDMLTEEYTPEEVFLEILRRAGKMKGDTVVPLPYKNNYTRDEVRRIILKNQPLHSLDFNDAMSLYERVALRFDRLVVYDKDNREEVVYNCDDLSSPNPQRADMCNAKSVAAVIPASRFTRNSKGDYVLTDYPRFGENYTYCDTERFLNQPAAAGCSAFVYDSVTLITTAHEQSESNIMRQYFVFDYIVDPRRGAGTAFPASCVFRARSTRLLKLGNMDICVVTLDRKVDPRRVPGFNSKNIKKGDSLYVIGCPVGIPLKLAGKVRVLESASPDFFMVDSDTYKGNSGSPVFNARTHQVEGYLVEGSEDFDLKDVVCSKVITCGHRECSGSKGEKVLRTSYFKQFLNR